ncbi:MAG: AAA family ATPase [Oscillospiraceae bacterium]
MQNQKLIAIGVEDFKELIDRKCYVVDKTMMIADLIRDNSKVKLFTRPRRFGKTLNLSMIKYFFEKTDESNAYLFDGMNISEYPEYMAYQGQYPVISISLKSMKQADYELTYNIFKSLIQKEYSHHKNAVYSSTELSEAEKKRYEAFVNMDASDSDYNLSLLFLSDYLKKAYHKNVILLIDEYDVPLENAFACGFYEQMINLIRSVFESALKTNSSLEFGILTGCLRVSKESIFTGLNNLKVCSILSAGYSDCFGFTQSEVDNMLEYYGLSEKREGIKLWYDGYKFHEAEIYNPWSLLMYVNESIIDKNAPLMQFWSNTSSNIIVRRLIEESDEETKATVEELINGVPVESYIYEDVTYGEIDINSNYIWSFLLFTGYLKVIDRQTIGNRQLYKMVIPNLEIKTIYEDSIINWFDKNIKSENRDDFFKAVLEKDAEKMNEYIQNWLADTISYYDERENYYHGFLAGVLTGFKGYRVVSNRESGNGRYDLFIKSRIGRSIGIILEFKISPTEDEMEEYADIAIQQIEDKNYEQELRNDRYKKIIKYGISFCEKLCYVKLSPYSD